MTGDSASLMQFVAGFYHALDSGDVAVGAAHFAAHGIWRRKGERLVGPEAVAAALAKRDESRRTVHLISNFYASAHPDGGWATRYCLSVYDNSERDACRLVMIMECNDIIMVSGNRFLIVEKSSKRLLPEGVGGIH